MTPLDTQISQKTTTIGMTIVAGAGVVLAFVRTVLTLAGLEDAAAAGGPLPVLVGADNELGYPSAAFMIALFAVVLAVGVAMLAGAKFAPGWWVALTPLTLLGVVFEAWALYLSFDWFTLVQLLLIAAAAAIAIVRMPKDRPQAALGTFLVVASLAGFFSAFRLTVDKVGTAVSPDTGLACNFSIIVQCGKNLASAQGAVFGFPNPLLGIGGWIAVLMVGIMVLAGLRFARWFWIAFNAGVAGALALVIWLIGQSIYVIGTLCPWCMATWAVTIPVFLLVTLYNLKSDTFGLPPRARRFFAGVYTYVPFITIVCYIVIAVMAQTWLNILGHL